MKNPKFKKKNNQEELPEDAKKGLIEIGLPPTWEALGQFMAGYRDSQIYLSFRKIEKEKGAYKLNVSPHLWDNKEIKSHDAFLWNILNVMAEAIKKGLFDEKSKIL